MGLIDRLKVDEKLQVEGAPVEWYGITFYIKSSSNPKNVKEYNKELEHLTKVHRKGVPLEESHAALRRQVVRLVAGWDEHEDVPEVSDEAKRSLAEIPDFVDFVATASGDLENYRANRIQDLAGN